MGLNLSPPVKVMIGLVVDDSLAMHRRIEAAEALMQSAVPDQVVDAVRRFLLGVAENPASVPSHRLAAAKVVLKRDMPKFKRQRIEPSRYDPLCETTAAELIADGLRRTAERDARLKLVSSVPEPPTDKAS
jgi:hypothetical protein